MEVQGSFHPTTGRRIHCCFESCQMNKSASPCLYFSWPTARLLPSHFFLSHTLEILKAHTPLSKCVGRQTLDLLTYRVFFSSVDDTKQLLCAYVIEFHYHGSTI